MSSKIEKVVPYALIVVSLIVLLIFTGLMVHLYRDVNIIDVKGPMKVLNPKRVVKAGDSVYLQFTYRKFNDVPEIITDQLVNGITMVLRTKNSNLPKSESWITTTIPVVIPEEVMPGRYHIQKTIEFEYSPIRHIVEHFDSEGFTVVASQRVITLEELNSGLRTLQKICTNYQQADKKTTALLVRSEALLTRLIAIEKRSMRNAIDCSAAETAHGLPCGKVGVK